MPVATIVATAGLGCAGAGWVAATGLLFATRIAGRGITAPLQPVTLAVVQLISGAFLAALVAPAAAAKAPTIAVALGAAAALGVAASLTDIRCQKIAKEPCWAAAAVGLYAYLQGDGLDHFGWFEFAAGVLGIVVVPFVAAVVTKGGLGFGDIRMLAAYACLLAWWVGAAPLMWGVIAACAFQLAARVVVRRGTSNAMPFGPALTAGVVGAIATTTLLS